MFSRTKMSKRLLFVGKKFGDTKQVIHFLNYIKMELIQNRIINSQSPDPFVTISKNKINYFQENIHLNLINETDFSIIDNSSQYSPIHLSI